jgi:FixJ family two-component response regulator
MARNDIVSVVDDDESVRESLPDLLRSLGFEVEPFSSAEEFLMSEAAGRTGCLVLDIAMPGMSGADLQMELIRQKRPIPIVFITSHADEAIRSRVMERGAVACLFKPFSEAAIQEAVTAAFGEP